MIPVKVLVFAGSARNGSVNKKLASVAARAAENAGATATYIDLADYPAAVFNADAEATNGLPDTMRKFKRLIATHDAILVSTPEYNGFVPPLLVNVFSWASRPENDEAPCAVFAAKPVAIVAASPGQLGGVRVIPRLRDYLAELGCVAVPGFVNLANAYEAFDEAGALRSEAATGLVADIARSLVSAARHS